MYTIRHKKKINFRTFKICRVYTFDQIILAWNHEYLESKTVINFFIN